MKVAGLALFGWLVPGGAYLLMRRYAHFAWSALLVITTFAVGLLLQGGVGAPHAGDLQGLDTLAGLVFQGGAVARMLAGVPFLIAERVAGSHGFLEGRVHEYGTTLLVLAGIFNVLAVSNALELRKAER